MRQSNFYCGLSNQVTARTIKALAAEDIGKQKRLWTISKQV